MRATAQAAIDAGERDTPAAREAQRIKAKANGAALRPPDHVQRCLRADRPNQLWVVDFTYVPTWLGIAFIAFVTDMFSLAT